MLTKTQKKEQITSAAENLKTSSSLIFADFTGVGVEEIRKLKNDLRQAGANFSIVKKRLLNIALKRQGIDLDALQFTGPVGTVFAPDDLTAVAAKVYKFGQAAKTFQVLGAYDLKINSFLSRDEFMVIAKLPSREVLLAQIMGGITGPLRAFMSIVKQLAEKPAAAEAVAGKGGVAASAESGEKNQAAAIEKPAQAPAEDKPMASAPVGETGDETKNSDKVEEK